MNGNPIASALEIVGANAVPAGRSVDPGDTPAVGSWVQLVDMLRTSVRKRRSEVDRTALPHPLTSPQECADAHLEEIDQALGKVPRGPNQAALLRKLAVWWVDTFGDAGDAEWDGSADHWRESLRSIRGVNHETADRILLRVAGKPAWPVSRPSLRIACRHGWIDPGAEYDEWQSLFVRGAEADVAALQRLATAFEEIGRQHCGPTPKCEGCPLAPLLPSGGPREMSD